MIALGGPIQDVPTRLSVRLDDEKVRSHGIAPKPWERAKAKERQ
jgi:hypothetical protein